ncbi:zinc-binding dehydrogenase [Seohaeicola zhoushanensis]
MSFVDAAAFFSAFGTAHHALVRRAAVKEGETLVVLGAAGAVGLAAIQLGKLLGLTVIAVAGGTAKADAVRRRGADHVIDHKTEDLRSALKTLTKGAGAEVCLDLVGGDAFDAMSRLMAWGGRLVTVGYASGRIPSLPANLAMLKGYALVGAHWWPATQRDPAQHQADFVTMLRYWKDGAVTPDVHKILPFSEAASAIHALGERTVTGKQVLVPDDIWEEQE